jgi:YbbR domain-containing protein
MAACGGALETDLLVPVQFSGIPEGLTVVGPPPKGVEVRVAGPQSALATLADQQPVYRLDLSKVVPGVQNLPIRAERLELPKGLTVRRILPLRLTVRIEPEIRRELEIQLRITGKPAVGFQVTGETILPAVVALRGPASIMEALDKVHTKPVDITSMTGPVHKELAFDLPAGVTIDHAGEGPAAEIRIEPRIEQRRFDNLPLEVRNTPHRFEITPAVIHIEVKGPATTLETLTAGKNLAVFMDLENLDPGVYVRRATITLPVDTTLVQVNPELFTVKLSAVKRETGGDGSSGPKQ